METMLLTRIFGSECKTIIPVVDLIAGRCLCLVLVRFVQHFIDVIYSRQMDKSGRKQKKHRII